MDMSMGTATASASAATSTAMSMSMGGGACKVSMLWNWYTINACFLSESWHVTSKGMFAGSCIGVIFLSISLSFLRRLHRSYDAMILRDAAKSFSINSRRTSSIESPSGSDSPPTGPKLMSSPQLRGATCASPISYRPNVMQQAIRAFLHMAQFAVAYFVMLLAMYFNGYIIISIFIGAFLGYFIFEWGPMAQLSQKEEENSAQEVTGCCG